LIFYDVMVLWSCPC